MAYPKSGYAGYTSGFGVVRAQRFVASTGSLSAPAFEVGTLGTTGYGLTASGSFLSLVVDGSEKIGAISSLVRALGALSVNSGLLISETAIDDGDSPYTIATSTPIILADATLGAITANLPASPTSNMLQWVKNTGSGSNVTVGRNGKNINGAAADITLTPGTQALLQFDGTEWWTIGGD